MTVVILTGIDPKGAPQGDRLRLRGLMTGAKTVFGSVEVIYAEENPKVDVRPLWYGMTRAAVSGCPYMLRSSYRWKGTEPVDGVIAFQLRMAPLALAVGAQWRILDLTDSLSLYRRRLGMTAPTMVKWATLTGVGRQERHWAPRFDQVWVSAEPDRAWLKDRGVASRVVGNGVIERRPLPPGNVARLLFVGNLAYLPNRLGLSTFLKEVWPHLRAQGYVLDVVGQGSERLSLDGVRGYGRVDDLVPYYQKAGIAISPVRLGAGSQNKILEALGYGRPVVAVPEALTGLPLGARRAVLAADTPKEWTTALKHLSDAQIYQEVSLAGVEAVEVWGGAVARALGDFLGQKTFAGLNNLV